MKLLFLSFALACATRSAAVAAQPFEAASDAFSPSQTQPVAIAPPVAPHPEFSLSRGWFDAPFMLVMGTADPDATIRYTKDGSPPSETTGTIYSEPLQISTTTVLRAATFKSGSLPSPVVTQTYLFAPDVLRQPNDPPGFPVGPTVMAGYPSDYEMDPDIVTDPRYAPHMKQALRALPAMSIVCSIEEMFGAETGIYTHPTSRGPEWERPCSVEFLPNDGTPGFHVTAGIQIQGNAARDPRKQPKHPFRLVFKSEYGPKQLKFPMFPDSPVTRFDTLVLRADFNFSWLHWSPNQRNRAQRIRDAWMKDTMRAMGGLASHNRYVHLFINGLYWGIYDPTERPDGAFAAAYLGGEKEEYDVINEGSVVDGSSQSYKAMLAITDLANPAAFAQMQQYLDLTQFIDYMLLHFYAGHQDWGRNKNWYAIRPKDGRYGFLYVPWDGENILDSVNHNRVADANTPSDLHTKLVANPEYRLAFADRVQKHLFDGGALTPAAIQSRWIHRTREIELAILAESARWGDYRRDVHQFQTGPYELYTRDRQWRNEQNRLLNEYFPRRTSILLAQLREAELYPKTPAPTLNHKGGAVEPGFQLAMQAPAGSIYFTTDGTDPRTAGGTQAVSRSATAFNSPLQLTNSVHINARTLHQNVWSALVTADFFVNEPEQPVRITEIMYHPLEGEEYEFIEIRNISSLEVDVGGFHFSGIEFVFPHRTLLRPRETIVIASNDAPTAFASRYPGVAVAGWYRRSLSNAGERIELLDRSGRTVTAVAYGDENGWPKSADGQGFSLEVVDAAAPSDDPANWTASTLLHGSPGQYQTDADGDGLPDAWETKYGTDPALPDAQVDPDNDQLTNAEEYAAGTHPNDRTSNLQLAAIVTETGSVALQFTALANRSYSLLYTDAIRNGRWTKLADTASRAEVRTETVLDPLPATTHRFYRLVTPQQP